ncbi:MULTISPECIES: heme o synthase [Bacillales]|uniref:heme o synthase n=1 Tax=Bacillales TaxID=1385 RepID=UPI001E313BE7|nr:heme o synthase [Metabacillus sp. B2-18]UGB30975.1 heme o synthase [Metabacillus sp. B2-18]
MGNKNKSGTAEKCSIAFQLVKVGIVKSNVLAVIAGMCLACISIEVTLLENGLVMVLTIIGSAFVISSAGVFNNLYDRDIDFLMERTRYRPTITGAISDLTAFMAGSILLIAGVGLLYVAEPLAALYGWLGWFLYLVPYTIWSKRRTIYNTEIGSLSGAITPLIGWSAISSGELHLSIIGLFLIMVLWQMPHFYAIAIHRYEEYKLARIPMLPVIKGFERTYFQTHVYLLGLIFASFLFIELRAIFILILLLSISWFLLSVSWKKRMPFKQWASKMFVF